MLRNNIKIAWRNIKRNKVYSLINILGLTVGLCACMIVGTIILDDLSYDKHWNRADDIYRIVTLNKMGNDLYDRFPSSFAGLLSILKNDYSEVENAGSIVPSNLRIRMEEEDPNGLKIRTLMVDTSFWEILDVEVLIGSPEKYVAGYNNIIITESFKNKYFKNENPVGKIVKNVPTYQSKAASYLITGVIKDIPSNSVMRTDAIITFPPFVESLNKEGHGTFLQSYVLFQPGADIEVFTQKFNDWYHVFTESKIDYEFEFQPLKDIYLHSDFSPYQTVKGDYKNVLILSSVALLLLVISCVNYINLSTAKAVFKLKESGIRKILGANKKQLMEQFFVETIVIFLVSMFIAFIIYGLSIDLIGDFLERPLAVNIIKMPSLFIGTLFGALLLSFFIGFYPAWFLTRFNPIASIKGKLFASKQGSQDLIKKGLVVLQFGISIFVLIALFVVQYQLSFMKNADLGYNKKNLLSISTINWNGKGEAFKQELKKITGVEEVAISTWNAGGGAYMSRQVENPEKPSEKIEIWYINGDANLAETIGLKLKEGRFLNPFLRTDAIPPDSSQVKMKNRSALLTSSSYRLLKAEGLNKRLANAEVVPVGVIEDFNSESLKTQIKPTIITAEDSLRYGYMMIRVLPDTDSKVIQNIHNIWRDFFPENLLEIKRVEDILTHQYRTEEKLGKIFTFFSSLTMLLAALGIFGLIMQATAQRTKEIGIRKVLGASVGSIIRLFSLDFIKLILIALVIASPIAWWTMNNWLQDYAYRITIHWWIFGIAGLTAIVIALSTINLHAIKAAMANPVDSLRDE